MDNTFSTTANVNSLDGKTYIELPEGLVSKLEISDNDKLVFTVNEKTSRMWKALNAPIPNDVHSNLVKLFKGDERCIIEWLYTPKKPLENKAPIELLKIIGGNEKVLDLIEQIKTGDFS